MLNKLLVGSWLMLGLLSLIWVAIPSVNLQAEVSVNHDFNEPANEQSISTEPVIFMFGRDTCGFCLAQIEYLESQGLPHVYLNLDDEATAVLFEKVTSKHGLPKITPTTVVGERVFQGWNSPRTTGRQITYAQMAAADSEIRTIADHLALAPVQSVTAAGYCSDLECTDPLASGFVFDLPILGLVDLRSFSLFSLSLVLGIIDGFNPCAMWVLVTFIILLSQVGGRQKMIILAGFFILAQGLMYNLILNVWYQTWDFIKLDNIVTPLVGLLALGGGIFFLWRWYKNRRKNQLVCDITNLETQSKVTNRFKEIAEKPITIVSVFGILAIAFSVNVIEFACSIGIPQAYTKILEINALGFMERQWYILIFTLGYMLDDVVVFALAIWGYGRLQAQGGAYAQLSLLVGGILMTILGVILLLNPELLVL